MMIKKKKKKVEIKFHLRKSYVIIMLIRHLERKNKKPISVLIKDRKKETKTNVSSYEKLCYNRKSYAIIMLNRYVKRKKGKKKLRIQ